MQQTDGKEATITTQRNTPKQPKFNPNSTQKQAISNKDMDKDKEKNKKKDMDRGEKTPCCFGKQPPSIVSVCGNNATLSESMGATDREGCKGKERPPAALQHFTDGELLAEIQRRGYEAHRWLADDWHGEATGWGQ